VADAIAKLDNLPDAARQIQDVSAASRCRTHFEREKNRRRLTRGNLKLEVISISSTGRDSQASLEADGHADRLRPLVKLGSNTQSIR